MLSENSNLFYDISWIVYDDYIAKDAESLQICAALIEKFPDRFILGSDKVGHWDTYPSEIQKYKPLLNLLSDRTAKMLCSENIMHLIKK
jgi:hypothetical protein